MLERQALSLRPWAPSDKRLTDPGSSGRARARAILDAATGTPQGFACWQLEPGTSWLRWLTWPVLEVHEMEDEPLLFTVQRVWAWTPCWEVSDAEGHTVGSFRAGIICDRCPRACAVVDRSADGSVTHFRSLDGSDWGTLVRNGESAELTYSAKLDDEPIAKMMLLAAALTLTE